MAAPNVNKDLCSACGICVDECPNSVIDLEDTAVMARPDDCIECGICIDACPNGALSF